MCKLIFRRALALLPCLLLLPTNPRANASTSLQTQATEIGAAIAGVGAALAIVVVVLVVHYKPATVKGCVASGPNGLQLTNSSDKLTYDLSGDTSSLKPGEMFKLKGKKKHAKGSANSTFTIKEIGKDYGSCPTTPNP